ncbi:MAG: Peptidase, family [Planctomycetaceae bacterium]|nr:Peptidase, family [Planctomycetaceae bacterium]
MYEPLHFSGGVFSAQIDGGRAGAEIELDTTSIVARASTGQTFSIPFRDCNLDLGGSSGRMVFCRTSDRTMTIFCEDRPFLAALEREARSDLSEQITSLRARRSSERWKSQFFLWFGGVAAILLLIGSYYGLIALAKLSTRALPVSVDEKIGKLALDSIDLGGPVVRDKVVVKAVDEIIKTLEPHSELKGLTFEVRIIDSPEVNAYCLPGGKMVVCTGLLKKAKDPEQVAGILSHEMAHAIRRHGLQRVAESLGLIAAVELLIGDVGGLVAIGVELTKQGTLTSFSRAAETEADIVGATMMHDAGIDPRELAKFFELLRDEGNNAPGAIAWLSTHPQHDVRITTIRGLLAKFPPKAYRALEIDWPEVQKHLANLNAGD